jgi:hypothetical protein
MIFKLSLSLSLSLSTHTLEQMQFCHRSSHTVRALWRMLFSLNGLTSGIQRCGLVLLSYRYLCRRCVWQCITDMRQIGRDIMRDVLTHAWLTGCACLCINLCLSMKRACVCIYIYIYIYISTVLWINTWQVRIAYPTCILACTHACIYTSINTDTHKNKHTYVHIHTHVYTHTHAYTRTYIHTYSTYVHTYRTYIHTYTGVDTDTSKAISVTWTLSGARIRTCVCVIAHACECMHAFTLKMYAAYFPHKFLITCLFLSFVLVDWCVNLCICTLMHMYIYGFTHVQTHTLTRCIHIHIILQRCSTRITAWMRQTDGQNHWARISGPHKRCIGACFKRTTIFCYFV